MVQGGICLRLKTVLYACCDLRLPHFFIVNFEVISLVPSRNKSNVPVFFPGEHTVASW